MGLQIRRGTETERLAMGAGDPAAGEILYITDTDKVYVGDGSTVGGVEVGSGGTVTSVFTRSGAVVAAADDYTWAQVDKTTSSIADLTTKNHTDLTAGDGSDHSGVALNTTHRGLTDNPHSVDETDTLPAQATHSGEFLTTDGTNSSWAAGGSGDPDQNLYETFIGDTGTTTAGTTTATLDIEGGTGIVTLGATDKVTVTTVDSEIVHGDLSGGHNLTTDIDHDTITNNHNLTTDIDHATITNGTATVAHGATGAVVGTTNTQTLSAKTLTTPTIGDMTNATHDHADAAGGGTIATGDLDLYEAIQVQMELTVGEEIQYVAPFAMSITGWTMLLDVSGSAAIDVWKDTYANYPPLVGDTIVTPSVTSDTDNQATGLSIAVAKGDCIIFHVDSATTSELATLALTGVRT